jgi:hypothetical protein
MQIPLRMAIWQRDHEGRPVAAGELIHHSDAGSQPRFTSVVVCAELLQAGIAGSIGTVG